MASRVLVIFYLTDMVLEIQGLQDTVAGTYLNAATVTVDVHKKSDDSAVTGATGLVMNYVAASNGVYRVTIPDTASIERDEQYIAKITVDAGAGLNGYWEIDMRSQVRFE